MFGEKLPGQFSLHHPLRTAPPCKQGNLINWLQNTINQVNSIKYFLVIRSVWDYYCRGWSIWNNIWPIIYWLCKKNVLLVSALNFVKEVSTVRLKESLVTDRQVRFGRDQPFMSALARCPPYSGVRLIRESLLYYRIRCYWCIITL